MSATNRLFVAIYPPRTVVDALLQARRAHDPPDCRETPPEQVHLTLQFIGERRRDELEAVTESVRRSASGLAPFTLTPQRLISLPKRGRPRLIAAETDAPAQIMELQRRLAQRLARSPRNRPGDRFTPHITLCRYSKMGRPRRIEAALDVLAFPVEHVMLMRSALLPGGAEHREVASIALET